MRAEEALKQNQEWLRLTMAGSRMGTWTRELDETNRVVWSPELEQIFGLEPGEFPRKRKTSLSSFIRKTASGVPGRDGCRRIPHRLRR